MRDEFWDRPEVVDQFAARDPDHRLLTLVDDYPRPASVRVLDLGCAGGRNAVLLAEGGFDLYAIDASPAMVARTRDRLRPIIGDAAADRVQVGSMDDLSSFASGSFQLVIALGIYHNARSRSEWERAIAETERVLGSDGRLLVNHFTPGVDLTGEGVWPVPDEPDVYEGFPGGRVVLLEAAALDAAMGAYGLGPEVPSRTVRVELERGRRESVNALYRKAASGASMPNGLQAASTGS